MEYLLGNKDLLSLAYLFRRLYKKFAALMRIEWVPVHSILSVFLLCLYVAQLKRRRSYDLICKDRRQDRPTENKKANEFSSNTKI